MNEQKFLCRGCLNMDELDKVPGVPNGVNLPKKKCAILECPQEIPCNPCQNCCPTGAITLERDEMTSLPVINPEKCIGCGTCVAVCPGMAIFTLDPNYSDDLIQVEIPYEFFPVPEVGQKVTVHDRSGDYLCDGEISKVSCIDKFDHTVILGFTCEKKYGMTARSIRRKEGE